MFRRTKLPGLIIVFFLTTGCVFTPEAELVMQYEGQLDPLMGKGPEEVFPLVTGQWKFEFLSNWAKVNPTPEIALERTHRSAPFSKKEAQKIFEENGYYDVMIYFRKAGEGSKSIPGMDAERMLSYHGGREIKYTSYVVLRMVFQDKKLHNYHFFHFKIGS
jgi:hypothetical protein